MNCKDRGWLYTKYSTEGLTCKQIALICGCHYRTIHQRLVKFNIPRRVGGFNAMSEEAKECRRKQVVQWRKEHPEIKGMLGKHHSLSSRLKMSLSKRGSKHPNWQGGNTSENELDRRRIEYKNWRIGVYKRDKYICQLCGIKCNKKVGLNAHHIKSFSKYPTLRFDINNGVTLCNDCHKKFIMKGNQHTEKKEIESYIKEAL